MAINYEVLDNSETMRIVLHDPAGRVIDQFSVAGKVGQQVVDLRNYAPGACIVELL